MSVSLIVAALNGVHAQGTGTITGLVTEDSTGKPIAGAEVAIAKLKRQVLTDANGRFVIGDLPEGILMIVARRLGFEEQGNMVQVTAGQSRDKNVKLARVPTALDTVKVTAPMSLVMQRTFQLIEDHKKLGFGKFIDSTELRQRETSSVADLARAMMGVNVVTPPFCKPLGTKIYNCTPTPRKKVAVSGGSCAMRIMQDNMVLTVGGPIDQSDPRSDPRHDWVAAYDLTELSTSNLIAIEVYRRGGEVPLEYQNQGTECGLIQLWTKRQ